jgi:hypothetical protein
MNDMFSEASFEFDKIKAQEALTNSREKVVWFDCKLRQNQTEVDYLILEFDALRSVIKFHELSSDRTQKTRETPFGSDPKQVFSENQICQARARLEEVTKRLERYREKVAKITEVIEFVRNDIQLLECILKMEFRPKMMDSAFVDC